MAKQDVKTGDNRAAQTANSGETAGQQPQNKRETGIALPPVRLVSELNLGELHAQAVESFERFQATIGELATRIPCRAVTSGMPAINTAGFRILDHYAGLVQTTPQEGGNSVETAAQEGAGGADAGAAAGAGAAGGGGAAR